MKCMHEYTHSYPVLVKRIVDHPSFTNVTQQQGIDVPTASILHTMITCCSTPAFKTKCHLKRKQLKILMTALLLSG